MELIIEIQKIPENKEIIITHRYQNPVEVIWNAFTKTEVLEKWWAPEPYKAIIVTNNFEKGKCLFYYMLSPEWQKHYCITDFLEIDYLKSYEVLDAFCDENKIINKELPRAKWVNSFNFKDGITTVVNTISFEKIEDMTKILEMGFEEGYKMWLNQLYKVLNKK